MRLASQFRTLVVGLPLALSPALVVTQPAAGWGGNELREAEEYQIAPGQGGNVRVVGGAPIAPTPPRWTDGETVRQAHAEDADFTGGVQQTAHTGPSRSGTLFGGDKSAAALNPALERAAPAGQKGSTWHGYKLRNPMKLFSRGGEANASSQSMPSPAAAAARARQASTAEHMAAGARPTASVPNTRFNVNASPMTAGRPQNMPIAASRAAQPPRTAALPQRGVAQAPTTLNQPNQLPRPTAAARMPVPAPRSTQLPAPRPMQSSASFAGRAAATPTQSQPTQTAAVALEAKTPADHLILQAHELSASAQREDDYTRIIETCRRARVSQPSPPLADYAKQLSGWALNRRGQLKAESGRLKEAMLDFDDAVRANPELWRALHNRGVLQAQSGKFEAAFDDFNRTIQINPTFAKAYSNRAALFVVAGDLPAAFEDYGQAIELDPNLAVAHRGRGRVCHLLGRLDDGLDHYDAAVQLAPNDAYAVASRADLLTDLGRYADAAKGYDEAIRLDPQSGAAHRGSAWLLATCPDKSVRDAELAVERAKMAIELEGREDAVGFDTLAAALASAGDFPAAMQTLRQAIKIASADERPVYQDRLTMYQRAKPFRIAPVRDLAQVSYEEFEPR